MNESNRNAPGDDPVFSLSAKAVSGFGITMLQAMAIMVAVLPTAVSFGIAAYAGWSRGATPTQRLMSVAVAGVAVLYVHWALTVQRSFSVPVRVAGVLLWYAGIAVLMIGQVTFFIESQRDAGNRRAASVPVVEATQRADWPRGRSLSEIAKDRVQVVANLARVEARHCKGSCPGIVVRNAILDAQLAALNAETVEAKRREAEDDRLAAQAERADALTASLRADPVASQIASWIGTTESRLELVEATVFAVVLEGAAIMGWLWVALVWSRTASRAPVALGRAFDAAVAEPGKPVSSVAKPVEVATPADAPIKSEDHRALDEIHLEVVAGRLKPTQAAIRVFLGCGQATAGHVARLYRARFDSMGA